jgi:ubiquinone/menaquinone biosynthesis C-methylase UbiE
MVGPLITTPVLAESQSLLYFAYGALGVASRLWHASRTSSVHRSGEKEVHTMTPKPACLGEHNVSAFQDLSVAHAYRSRPLYPPVVFDLLATLIVDTPRRMLDMGCGTGARARHLVTRVQQVDAVDVSSAMIEEGRQLPHGDHPHLHWILGRIEEARLVPPYALVTAGESLHWMDWDTLLPRLQPLLTPHAMLVIVEIEHVLVPWSEALRVLIQRYSTIRDYERVDLVATLEQRRLFSVAGRRHTEPVPFVQSLEAYMESFHGRASLSRTRMPPEDADAFDQALRHLVSAVNPAQVALPIVVDITWGKPIRAHSDTA